MNIVIHDADSAEPEALSKAVERCSWWLSTASEIEIFVSARVPATAEPYEFPGSLEYGILVKWPAGSQLYVGMLQREIGAKYEFHS